VIFITKYAVVCAGSLLGVSMVRGDSFPVGKVDHMKLYPLTFKEFLRSADVDMYEYLETLKQVKPLPDIFFNRIYDSFLKYLICGGMPSAAKIMLEEKDSGNVDLVLHGIISDYRLDFSKHPASSLIPKLSHIWTSLPSQLARENKKFIYQLVRSGARAREYEDALLWLKQAGLIYSVALNRVPKLPLKAYDDLNAFKIYLCDIGVLRSLSEMPASVILSPNENYVEFKGACAENFVLQSLSSQFDVPLRYWTSKRNAEVDFLLQYGEDIIPIEVKSGSNVRGKSLKVYGDLFHPKYKIRYSIKNLSKDGEIINIPLFLCDYTVNILSW
jgi:predicted AAA+ superfamily ATPase